MINNTFFDAIVQTTKEARNHSVQLEHDANVLFKKLKHMVEEMIKSRASLGFAYVNVDTNNFNIDFTSKWSVSDLLNKVIANGYVPVNERLFGQASTPFTDFKITEICAHVFKIDWGHGINNTTPKQTHAFRVKQEPTQDPVHAFQKDPVHAFQTEPVHTFPITYDAIRLPTDEEVETFLADVLPFLNNKNV
jgi:hypothetical protein